MRRENEGVTNEGKEVRSPILLVALFDRGTKEEEEQKRQKKRRAGGLHNEEEEETEGGGRGWSCAMRVIS